MRLAPVVLLSLAACQPDPRDLARDSMSRAAAYLWQQQDVDGGWHSETYGLLSSGQSLTPLVLLALLELPADIERPPGGIRRAVEFICRHVNRSGALGLADETVADYPNYATALGVQALRRAGGRDDVVARMLSYLRGQQFSEELGWKPGDRPYGGWGMGGEPRRAPDHGHFDLSMSRAVVEAFAGTDAADPLVGRALSFLERCQNPDGGFLFSPAIEGIHKARDGDVLLSYGTTTADGILSLLAFGVDPQDERVTRAAAWLRDHHRFDRVPGFPGEQRGTWDVGLRYYWLAAYGRVLGLLDPDTIWRDELIARVTAKQSANGSWRNENRLVKEDDPLIATALALRALRATTRRARSAP